MDEDITKSSVERKNKLGLAHIPEDRHKYGLVLDFSLENNMVLKKYKSTRFQKNGFIKTDEIRSYSEDLIEKFDVRTSSGAKTIARTMSGGNQQKAIVAREISRDPDLLIAVQPTRGLDVGAIEYIHNKILEVRNKGKAVLLVSFELEEVMKLSDRILVMFEGEIVCELDPKTTTLQELGLYMAGAKKNYQYKKENSGNDTIEGR
jgi:simple sugar transport system ATP-binding protein